MSGSPTTVPVTKTCLSQKYILLTACHCLTGHAAILELISLFQSQIINWKSKRERFQNKSHSTYVFDEVLLINFTFHN